MISCAKEMLLVVVVECFAGKLKINFPYIWEKVSPFSIKITELRIDLTNDDLRVWFNEVFLKKKWSFVWSTTICNNG
jgi:hypothetical protein